MTIIGFAGRARHGKDYSAAHLAKLVGDDAHVRGFAQTMKQRVHGALWDVPGLEDAIRDKPPWLRKIYQAVGNEVRRAVPEFWITMLFRVALDMQKNVLIVPDVRYPNEVRAIRERGGKVIRVVRTQAGQMWYDPNTDPDHPSECSIDDLRDDEFDAIIEAESGMTGYLEHAVEGLAKKWGLHD